jgi:histidine triad (HIT) family protein
MPTLFERILAREIPAEIIYEDAHCFAIRDIDPKAPVHVLIIPRDPIPGVAALPDTGDHQHLLNAAKVIAENEGLTNGYRLVINQGDDAGQTVPHLHVHLLGGRKLGWPPG